jgi:hypothetical protein
MMFRVPLLADFKENHMYSSLVLKILTKKIRETRKLASIHEFKIIPRNLNEIVRIQLQECSVYMTIACIIDLSQNCQKIKWQ